MSRPKGPDFKDRMLLTRGKDRIAQESGNPAYWPNLDVVAQVERFAVQIIRRTREAVEGMPRNPMKIYHGTTDKSWGGSSGKPLVVVGISDRNMVHALRPHLDEFESSPTGFQWGYEGGGPRQLSYAILRDYLGRADQASCLIQPFEHYLATRLRRNAEWFIKAEELEAFLQEAQKSGVDWENPRSFEDY